MNQKLTREERKQAKADKKKLKSVRLAASHQELYVSNTPKIEFLPDTGKTPIIGSTLGSLEVPKQPISNHSGSRYGLKMTWCARSADCDGSWSWRCGDDLTEPRKWSDEEWLDPITSNLNNLEGLDWAEIQRMVSDTSHLMHHDHNIGDLCDEAIQRWFDLELDEFETIFRFRLGNKKRAWGIELRGHFYLIWYERDHKIYPV
ncbi:hypothetical protein [Tatumella sp. UBA2305]|uniref:hypothetical protein n=1 Tax=Tatumella sp. UBA2305 TaxID=1947647 RepID=UPI0025EB1EE6|nr:hypothetical protein [Tatumella sp. UBA2305]